MNWNLEGKTWDETEKKNEDVCGHILDQSNTYSIIPIGFRPSEPETRAYLGQFEFFNTSNNELDTLTYIKTTPS